MATISNNIQSIAIHLGSEYSHVAIVRNNSVPEFLKSIYDSTNIPSKVHLKHNTNKIITSCCEKFRNQNITEIIYDFKRHFCESNELFIQNYHYPFPITTNEHGQIIYKTDDYLFSPRQMIIIILKHLYSMILQKLKIKDIGSIVLTTPNWFNDIQINALSDAGKIRTLNTNEIQKLNI